MTVLVVTAQAYPARYYHAPATSGRDMDAKRPRLCLSTRECGNEKMLSGRRRVGPKRLGTRRQEFSGPRVFRGRNGFFVFLNWSFQL